MNNDHINKRIEETLDSFDGSVRAKPAPFLLTRINTRLAVDQGLTIWDRLTAFISRPVVAFGGILILLLLNISIISFNKTSDFNTAITQQTQQLAEDEFAVNVRAVYDIENITP